MIVVVDASVAIKWFILEPDRAAARQLLEPDKRLIAPELLVAEVANAMWRRLMTGAGDARQASLAAASLPRFFTRLVSLTPLATKALAIAAELRHPVYDCFYLALAEEQDATMITADRRLVARLAGSRWESRCQPLVAWSGQKLAVAAPSDFWLKVASRYGHRASAQITALGQIAPVPLKHPDILHGIPRPEAWLER